MLSKGGCPKTMLSIKDALEAVEGRWKLLILFSLSERPKRFGEISKSVVGITDKTLSKELKLLEANKLVKREVFDSFPPKVEYSITEHGTHDELLTKNGTYAKLVSLQSFEN